MDFLFRTIGGRDRRLNLPIFFSSKCFNCQWLVVAYSRNSFLGPAVFLVLFKDGRHRVGPRFRLLVSDVYQGNEEAG